MPATAPRQARRSSRTSVSSRSAARRVFFFARQPEAAQGPADRPGMDPDLCRRRRPVAVLGQGEVVVARDQTLEGGLGLAADDGLWPTPHRPGREPPLAEGRPEPAVHARTADREATGDLVLGCTLQRRADHTLAQVTRIGSRHGSPPDEEPTKPCPNWPAVRSRPGGSADHPDLARERARASTRQSAAEVGQLRWRGAGVLRSAFPARRPWPGRGGHGAPGSFAGRLPGRPGRAGLDLDDCPEGVERRGRNVLRDRDGTARRWAGQEGGKDEEQQSRPAAGGRPRAIAAGAGPQRAPPKISRIGSGHRGLHPRHALKTPQLRVMCLQSQRQTALVETALATRWARLRSRSFSRWA